MDNKETQAAVVIHGAATANGAIAGSMAQLAWFGADIPALAAVNIGMILALGKLFGQNLERTAIATLVGQISAVTVGTAVAKGLLGLIPIIGNFANAGTAFAITEALGWTIYKIFEEGKDPTKMPPGKVVEEMQDTMKDGLFPKPNVEERIKRMPSHDRARYESLQHKLKEKNLPDTEHQAILLEMAALMKRYP